MRLLLDTHVLLWFLDDDERLGVIARNAITDEENEVFVSTASIWEISIKQSLGKIRTPKSLMEVVKASRIKVIPIEPAHAMGVRDLPFHHKDPFDRLLVIQAKLGSMTLVTQDRVLAAYSVPILEA